MDYYGPNRFICSVFEEMRKAHETRNFGYLLSLIEEAQSMANRMEAAIEDKNDIERMAKKRSELNKEIKKLKAKVKKLKEE